MVALNIERNIALRLGDLRYDLVAANMKIFGGGLVMRNAAGYLTKGAVATGCFGVGRADETADNSAAGDLIVQTDIGNLYLTALASQETPMLPPNKPQTPEAVNLAT